MFGPAATTQKISKKFQNDRQMLGGGSEKRPTFKIQAAEAAKLRVFVGMIKGEAELKNPFYVKIQKNVCCSKCLWQCDRFHGGLYIGWKAVDIRDTTGQDMVMAY